MQIFAEQVPSLDMVVPKYAVHTNICSDVVRTVGHDLILFYADFRSICPHSVYEFSDAVFQFTVVATQKIDVVGES